MLESYYYILIEVSICFVITICLLKYYARKNINPVVIITAFLTWFLNLVLIVLLLFDIYYTQKKEGMNSEMPNITKNIIIYGYNIIYWSTFLLGWIFIPLMQSYEDSGEFTKIEKLKNSLKENLIYYGILLVIIIILLVFTIIKFGIEKTLIIIKDGSLIFGLFFFFFLLSYSLIKYPKTLYFKLNNSKQIQYHEWRANKFFNRLDEDKFDLINIFSCLKLTINNINEIDKINDEKDIKSIKESINTSINSKNSKNSRKKRGSLSMDLTDEPKKIKDYLEYMDKEYDNFLKLSSEFGIDLEKEKEEEQKPITSIKDLIKLNRKIKRKKQDNLRMQCRIKNCYNRWEILNTLFYLNNKKNEEDEEKNNKKKKENDEKEIDTKKELLFSLEEEGFIPLTNFSNFKIFYYSKLKKYFIFIIFIIHIIAVIITITCEIIMMSGFDIISKFLGIINNIYILHITTLIPFIYLIFMSNYTLFKIKISSFIYMYGHKQTDSVSLMVFSSYLSRIYFAVCLNCIQCLNQFSDNKISNFQEFFGIIKNENENNYFIFILCRFSPFVLFLFLIFFFFNIPDKLANFLGYNLFEFETEERDLMIKDGHAYLMNLNKKLGGKLLKYHDKKIFEER